MTTTRNLHPYCCESILAQELKATFVYGPLIFNKTQIEKEKRGNVESNFHSYSNLTSWQYFLGHSKKKKKPKYLYSTIYIIFHFECYLLEKGGHNLQSKGPRNFAKARNSNCPD